MDRENTQLSNERHTNDHHQRRRLFLQSAATGMAALAGCNFGQSSDDRETTAPPTQSDPNSSEPTTHGEPTPTDTVVFTDTPTPSSPDGAMFDGGDLEAFVAAVEAASDSASGRLVVEEGTYQFDSLLGERPGSNPAAEIQDVGDVTIEGNKAQFVFTVPWRGGLRFEHGHDLTIRNLKLDYDPVPFTQGRIVDLADDSRTITLDVDDGYPPLSHEMFDQAEQVWASLHRSNGQFIRGMKKRRDPRKFFSEFTHVDDRRFRLTLAERSLPRGLEEGRKLTIVARNGEAILALHKVDKPMLDTVAIYATAGAAFSTTVCTEPTYRDCTVAPPTGSGRQIGAVADGIRIINCSDGATVAGCRLAQLEDDGIVIQRNLTRVTDFVNDRTVRVAQVYPFVAGSGDILEVLAPDGTTKGRLPAVAAIEKRFDGEPGDRFDPKTITFAESVADELSTGDYLGNRATRCADFTIRDNEVRNLRANAVRVTTGPGTIEHNVFDGTSWNCIEFEATTGGHFGPRGWVRDVTVRDNDLRRPGLNFIALPDPAAVKVHYRSPPDVLTQDQPHGDIAVVDNTVEACAGLGILLEDVDPIRAEGNAIREVNRLGYPNAGYGFGMSNVGHAELRGNRVAGTGDRLTGFGWAERSGQITSTDNAMVVDGVETDPTVHRWKPVTIAFNRTVVPEHGDRALAARFTGFSLLDADNDAVKTVDFGEETDGIRFGSGIYPTEQLDSDTWRWFGGPADTATLYLFDDVLAAASTMELRGKAIQDGISATVRIGGQATDEVTFEDGPVQTYRVPFPNG